MSNNDYNIIENCIDLCNHNNNILGLITQSNIKYDNLMNFTPGISFNVVSISDQKYRNIENIKKTYMPDIIIVGRAIYNSKDVFSAVKQLNDKINL